MSPTITRHNRIESVDAALRVLESFLEWPEVPQGVSELSRRVGLSKNRTFRILQTLEGRGYLRKDPDTQTYQLGITLLRLANQIPRRLDMYRFASTQLKALAQQSGEVAHVIMRHGEHSACVGHHEGGRMLRVSDRIGQTHPLHVGASPKLFLAYAPDDERQRLLATIRLKEYTSHTITDVEILKKRLAEIRKVGYSVEEEDYEAGVCAVGAPVFNSRGTIVAGITITAPKSRFGSSERNRLIQLVTSTATKLSEQLGYKGAKRGGGVRSKPIGAVS
jgi:DNA-binding IclR family transcriptional regulator